MADKIKTDENTEEKPDRTDYWVGQPGDFIFLDSNKKPITVHVVANKGKEAFIKTAIDAFVDKGYLSDVDTSTGPSGEKAYSFDLHDTNLLRRIATLVKGKAKVSVDDGEDE